MTSDQHYNFAQMPLFADLDGPTWALSIAAIAISVAVIALDIRDWRAKYPILSRGKRALLWGFAAVCVLVGIDTISNASNAQHITVSGIPSVVRVRHGGRSGDTWLVRIGSAEGEASPLLALHNSGAIVAFQEYPKNRKISFGYLNASSYNGSDVPEFKVVDMADGETGESIYHFDTHSHPYRVAVLFASAILLFLTELLNNRLSDARPDTENDYENYRDSSNGQANAASDLTSLHLDDSSDKDSTRA